MQETLTRLFAMLPPSPDAPKTRSGRPACGSGLANLYAKLNHSFVISELSDAVSVIKKIKEGDLSASWIIRTIKVKDMGLGASFSTPGYDLETTFTTLSKNDFSLPLSNAKSIEDRYYRTIAVIAIARNCIDRPKKKSQL